MDSTFALAKELNDHLIVSSNIEKALSRLNTLTEYTSSCERYQKEASDLILSDLDALNEYFYKVDKYLFDFETFKESFDVTGKIYRRKHLEFKEEIQKLILRLTSKFKDVLETASQPRVFDLEKSSYDIEDPVIDSETLLMLHTLSQKLHSVLTKTGLSGPQYLQDCLEMRLNYLSQSLQLTYHDIVSRYKDHDESCRFCIIALTRLFEHLLHVEKTSVLSSLLPSQKMDAIYQNLTKVLVHIKLKEIYDKHIQQYFSNENHVIVSTLYWLDFISQYKSHLLDEVSETTDPEFKSFLKDYKAKLMDLFIDLMDETLAHFVNQQEASNLINVSNACYGGVFLPLIPISELLIALAKHQVALDCFTLPYGKYRQAPMNDHFKDSCFSLVFLYVLSTAEKVLHAHGKLYNKRSGLFSIFLLNNFDFLYSQTFIKNNFGLHDTTPFAEMLKRKLTVEIENQKIAYINCWRPVLDYFDDSIQSKGSLLKDRLKNFSNELENTIALHKIYTIPNQDLKLSIRTAIKDMVISEYNKYIHKHQTALASHPKWLRLDAESIESRLLSLYENV